MSKEKRYIEISNLPNYEIIGEAKTGPITDLVKCVVLPFEHLYDIPTAEDEIIDQIASFFEKKDNWLKLRDCWLENGYSHDFRRLLRKALEGTCDN